MKITKSQQTTGKLDRTSQQRSYSGLIQLRRVTSDWQV